MKLKKYAFIGTNGNYFVVEGLTPLDAYDTTKYGAKLFQSRGEIPEGYKALKLIVSYIAYKEIE